MTACIWYVSKYVSTPADGAVFSADRGYSIMREIARLGYGSVIVTSDSMPNASAVGRPYVFEDLEGIRLCRIRTLKYSSSKSMRRILSWIDFEWRLARLPKDSLPTPDVIVAGSLSLLTILNGLRLRRRYRCRLVFEVRDIWPLVLTEDGGFSPRNPLILGLGAIEKLGYRRADAIVGTMPNLGEHVEKVTGQPLPTHCVPMGVDMEALESSVPLPPDYATNNLPAGTFLVAYAGSIGISNALDVLMQCAEGMKADPGVHFVVLGAGDLRQAYVDKYGHLPNLTFLPSIQKSMVHDFLTRCDLLYFSASDSAVWDYGMSLNKVIDYMLAAKPILASYSGFPSMINEAGCGSFVQAGDVSSLREEIQRFKRMSAQDREAMGARGREWLLKNRDYRVLAQDYLRILLPEGVAR